MAELMEHKYFDKIFKAEFDSEFNNLVNKDSEHREDMAMQRHFTLDGRPEIPINEIFSETDEYSQVDNE